LALGAVKECVLSGGGVIQESWCFWFCRSVRQVLLLMVLFLHLVEHGDGNLVFHAGQLEPLVH
jgi:hypothetical protein